MIDKPFPKRPRRFSQIQPIEETKPSRLIEIFWWVVFIVPMVLTWIATQSVIIIVILLAIRLLIMVVPMLTNRNKRTKKNHAEEMPIKKEKLLESVKSGKNILSPYIEEAKQEWMDFLKLIRVYDKDNEDKMLEAYRKMRGWE